MHQCIPYEIVDVYLMIRTWVFVGAGGTDKSVPYENAGRHPIHQPKDHAGKLSAAWLFFIR